MSNTSSGGNTKTFRILYTNQLRKKVPSFKDGFLKYNLDTKSLLILDEKNNKVEQTFLSHCDGATNCVENGEEISTKTLRIQIEDEISSSTPNNGQSSSSIPSSTLSQQSSTLSSSSSSYSTTNKPSQPSSLLPPRTTNNAITRTTTTTSVRKPFKPPLKENFDSWKRNYGGDQQQQQDSTGGMNMNTTNTSTRQNSQPSSSRLTPSPMFQQHSSLATSQANSRLPPSRAAAVVHRDLDDEFSFDDSDLVDLGDIDVPPQPSPRSTSKFFKSSDSIISSGGSNMSSSFKSASQVAPKQPLTTSSNIQNNVNRNPPPQQHQQPTTTYGRTSSTPQQLYDEEDDENFDFTELEFENQSSGGQQSSSTASFLKSKFNQSENQNKPSQRALYRPPSFEEEDKEVPYDENEFIMEEDEPPVVQQQKPHSHPASLNSRPATSQSSTTRPPIMSSNNHHNHLQANNTKPKLDLMIDDDDFQDGLISMPPEAKSNRPQQYQQTTVPPPTNKISNVHNVNNNNNGGFQSASKIVQKPPQLDISLENLDVDSDEDLKLDSPPTKKQSIATSSSSSNSSFKPPSRINPNTSSKTTTPKSNNQQPSKQRLLMDDDDDDDDNGNNTIFTPSQSTPSSNKSSTGGSSGSSSSKTFTPPQRFIPPSPSSASSSSSSTQSNQQQTTTTPPNSLPTKKFAPPTKVSPNKKFKQTQLSMGQKESPKQAIPTNTNTTTDIPILSLVQKLKRTKHEIIFPDMEMNDLYEQNNTHPKRFIEVPNKFTSIEHYKAVFLDAIFEEMNLQMFNLSNNFYKTYRKITQTGSMAGTPKTDNAPLCKCHLKAKLKIVKKDGPNKGKPFYGCGKPTMNDTCNFFSWANNVHPSFVTNSRNGFLENKTGDFDRMSFFRRNGVHFYFGCELVKQTFGSSRKKNAITQWFLQVENKEKSVVYAKDDIWILSKAKDFQYKTGHLVIAKSVFHGPDKDGKIELEIISGIGDNLEQETLFAVRGPNFSTEFEMIENLTDLDPLKLPLLPEILGTTEQESLEMFRKRLKTKFKPPKSSTTTTDGEQGESSASDAKEGDEEQTNDQSINFELGMEHDELFHTAKSFVEEYKLNEDQANLIYRCAKWFEKGDASSPICLVHGVFGAGKTTLLIVLILFMCRVLDEADNSSIRILIASVTNVAVDNILEGLITENYKNLVRVGSQKKIAKSVLPYTVSTENTSVKDQIKSLKDMLKDKDIDPDEEAGIKQAIKDLQSGVYENRKQSIKDARVVGVTCAATGFEVLKNQKFSILILDESSQCLEPLALLPLARFSCMKFVAVGDPLQLPPTLTGSRSGENKEDSLEKTIFIRLSNIGCEPHLLRTQYRCHPKISRITNELFYENKLVDGICESDREALIPGMPPVLMIDCENGTETSENNSYKNELEAKAIIHTIQLLLQDGIAHEDIGVIALYKTQETYLKTQFITSNLKAVKVSTVDAFQGGEKNIVFVSTSRTSEYGLAFIEQKQRLNVALSRARNHLIIVGKMKTLLKGAVWSKVIGHAQKIPGSIWLSDIILANNDFDFLGKFKHCYHPSMKPTTTTTNSKQVLLDDDDDSILSEELILKKPKEKRNKHLEKLSAVRHRHKIEVDENELEYDFEEEENQATSTPPPTTIATTEDHDTKVSSSPKDRTVDLVEEHEYQFSDDEEEIDFNIADEIMKENESTSNSSNTNNTTTKRKIDEVSVTAPNEEEQVLYNNTPKKKKLSSSSEVDIIEEEEFQLMPTPESSDKKGGSLDSKPNDVLATPTTTTTFNEPLQTLNQPTINFPEMNADLGIKLTQDNNDTLKEKSSTAVATIDYDDLSYLDDL